MSLLSYDELVELVKQGVITGVKPESINATSIDLHLGPIILAEQYSEELPVIDLGAIPRQSVPRTKFDITGNYYDLLPGENCLGHTTEIFHLPNTIGAEYYLNSSQARNTLEHLHAGHCDPGWNGSSLTLELVNLNRYHRLRLREGMRCGQILLYRVTEVPEHRSYATIGSYNNDATASGVKP